MDKKLESIKNHFLAQPKRFTDDKQWLLSLNGYTSKDEIAVHISGDSADCSEFDSQGREYFGIIGGNHHGHCLMIDTSKENCGAYFEDWYCTCGKEWHNATSGCWQYEHSREESGEEFGIKLIY